MAVCEVCGVRSSRYVCQKCGRRVCESCFNPYSWVCSECYSGAEPQVAEEHRGMELPLKLFIIGFIVIFVGMMIMAISSLMLGARVSGGVIIFPFIPLPIVFGFGPEAALVTIIAILLLLAVLIVAIARAVRFS
jgi:uncharacterized membrane protein